MVGIGEMFGDYVPSVSITPTQVIAFFAVIGALMVIAYIARPYLYPIKVVIRRKVGQGEIVVEDHGKIITTETGRQLHVFNSNRYAPVPSTSNLYPYKGGFKKWYIEMYQDGNGDLVEGEIKLTPITTNAKEYEAKFVPTQQDLTSWARVNQKRLTNRYQNDFWDKYGVLVGQGALVLAIIVFGMFIANKNVEAANIMARGMELLSTAMQLKGGA